MDHRRPIELFHDRMKKILAMLWLQTPMIHIVNGIIGRCAAIALDDSIMIDKNYANRFTVFCYVKVPSHLASLYHI